MKIALSKPVPSRVYVDGTVQEAEILKFEDDPIEQRVTCTFRLGPFPVEGQPKPIPGKIQRLLLWEKDAYDAIGQYTDDQVKARLNELLTATV